MSAPINSRRSLLAVAFAGIAAAAMPAPAVSEVEQIQNAAHAMAAAMARRHGGTWEANVDHDFGFVLVSPRTAAKGGAQ